MDHRDFVTHDTPGPPAHANNMSQPADELLGYYTPVFLQRWSFASQSYSQPQMANPAFPSGYSFPDESYLASGVAGVSPTLTNAHQHQMPTGPWPPTLLPHQANGVSVNSFTAATSYSDRQTYHGGRRQSVRRNTAESPYAFAQQAAAAAAATNRQPLPGAVNPQFAPNLAGNQHPDNQTDHFPGAATFSLHSRHHSPPVQQPQRSAQSRNRSSQSHRHTASTSALEENLIGDRISQPSFSERRRLEHMRGRRSSNARLSASESHTEGGRTLGGSLVLYPGARRQATMNHAGPLEEAETRRMQLLRGALTSRLVVSKAALQSLQAVDVKDLPEGERTCMICYNDYEMQSPEGFKERPIRLPKCKHVFGNHCIRKWFQESDSCPYCRDKLHSEPRHYPSSTRAFLDMMRIRGWTLGSDSAEDFYRRITTGEDVRASLSGVRTTAGRRPPPDDSIDESSRRTRQRRSSSSSVEQESFSPMRSPVGHGRTTSRHQTTSSSSGQASPTQAGVPSNPWILMGPGNAGLSGVIPHNAQFRYQSPARPAQANGVHQQSARALPSAARQRAYMRNIGSVASTSTMPNPLRNRTELQQMSQISAMMTPVSQLLDELYSSAQESPSP